jgi:hypothetical protein
MYCIETYFYFAGPLSPTSSTDASKSAANLSKTVVSSIYTNKNNIPGLNQACLELLCYRTFAYTFSYMAAPLNFRVYLYFCWFNDIVNI